jgi:hypothetical protein
MLIPTRVTEPTCTSQEVLAYDLDDTIVMSTRAVKFVGTYHSDELCRAASDVKVAVQGIVDVAGDSEQHSFRAREALIEALSMHCGFEDPEDPHQRFRLLHAWRVGAPDAHTLTLRTHSSSI